MDTPSEIEINALGSRKRPLYVYIIGVVIALCVLNYLVWFMDPTATLHTSLVFSGGFLLGLLAMYIAVHLYRWK